MKTAYLKDTLRSVSKGWKRFLSITVITALGVAMLSGLYIGCLDLYNSIDHFYDEQSLFDIRVVSTLGLTPEDIAALYDIDKVESAEGGYSERVFTTVDAVQKEADIFIISDALNKPYLLSGTLPAQSGEIAVTQKYIDESGKKLGDFIDIKEDIKTVEESDKNDDDDQIEIEAEEETPNFTRTGFKITAIILDPADIQSDGLGSNFRAGMSADFSFFINKSDAEFEIYTAAYILLKDIKGKSTFTAEYQDEIQSVMEQIEQSLKSEREALRYDFVMTDSRSKIEEAEKKMKDKLSDAEQELATAQKEIEDARKELTDGEAELKDQEKEAEQKINDAKAELEKGKAELEKAEQELKDGEALLLEGEDELNQKESELEQGKKQLESEKAKAYEQFADAEKQFESEQNKLDSALGEITPAVNQLQQAMGAFWPAAEWENLVNKIETLTLSGISDDEIPLMAQSEIAALSAKLGEHAETALPLGIGLGKIKGGQQLLKIQKDSFETQKSFALAEFAAAQAKLDDGETQLNDARKTIEEKKAEISKGKAELEQGKKELAEGQNTLNKEEKDAKKQIEDAWKKLNDGKEELAEGEATLKENETEYLTKKEEALQKIADAYSELEDIPKAKWYIQDRYSLDSYSSLNDDLSSIEAVGRVFPIIFLAVAILMSLTTMTRMVEEERSLIGTYKALGVKSSAIYMKYIIFAFLACLAGGVLGDILGFIALPKFVAVIMAELYIIPYHFLSFDLLYGIGGVILFMAGILGATFLACRRELYQMPAPLMRPKPPISGSRVLLERVGFIWERLKFLNKVTVRNLFRYKKRLTMTIGGIMGCTGLILCGFAIKDSIFDLPRKQYDTIYNYDLAAVFDEEKNSDMIELIKSDENVTSYINFRMENVKLINTKNESENVQLNVLPINSSVLEYINLITPKKEPITMGSEGVLVTQNAAELLKLKKGDRIIIQDSALVQRETVISDIAQNYLGNNIYISEELYEELFKSLQPNAIFANLSEEIDQGEYADILLEKSEVLSSVSTKAIRVKYEFDLINAIILIIIGMAGGLALVVLFTLSNTNISERIRELATIKVLGFYDHEVHQYVNKETLLLTLIGNLLGLPFGYVLSQALMSALKMPSINFALHIKPISYLFAFSITLIFALVISLLTNRTLNRINMVEALKSVE